jgi:hypothetical protein
MRGGLRQTSWGLGGEWGIPRRHRAGLLSCKTGGREKKLPFLAPPPPSPSGKGRESDTCKAIPSLFPFPTLRRFTCDAALPYPAPTGRAPGYAARTGALPNKGDGS